MGCDIHTNVEVRQPDGSWKNFHAWNKEDDYLSPENELLSNRNYDLFAILADVRNGRGFAGVKTGEGFNPIFEPRGVPEDASPEYRAWAEQWDGDGHSHSWVTVAEMMAYDWTQTTQKVGVVSLQEWAQYKVNGSPSSWAGNVMGKGIRHFSIAEVEGAFLSSKMDIWKIYHADETAMTRFKEELSKEGLPFREAFTTVRWKIPYYRAGRELLSEVLPQLWRLGKPEDVRLCFFFDN